MRDYKEQAQAAGFLFLKGALKPLLFSQHFGLGLNLVGWHPGSPKGPPPTSPCSPPAWGLPVNAKHERKTGLGGDHPSLGTPKPPPSPPSSPVKARAERGSA